jgi:hypothetical protein
MEILVILGGFGRRKTKPKPAFGRKSEVRNMKSEMSLKSTFEKTKPIYSYCVLRDAYCEKEFEKTNPILVSPQACSGG